MNTLRLAWRLAAREAKASRLKFLFVALGVAAGVGALTGVRGFSEAFQQALRREARTLMAADILIRQFAPPSDKQLAYIDELVARGAHVTRVTETVSMMGTPGGTPVLVSVKAVDPAVYPFYGKVKLEPDIPLKDALTDNNIAVSDDVMPRLGAGIGEEVKLGDATFRVVAVTRLEPDRMTGSLNFGPRVLISRGGLERSGLMTFGSRASHRILFRLPAEGLPIEEVRPELKKRFPESLIADYRESHPVIARALDRSTTFLSLVSLIALIVGSLGVAMALYSHLQQRLDSIAILKCLGATSRQIIGIYSMQAVLIGLAGGFAGLLVGIAVQQAFPILLSKYFQFEHGVPWSAAFALEGLAAGLLVALLFTVPPLLSIREVKPSLIFRREMSETKGSRWRRWAPAAFSTLLIVAALAGLAAWIGGSFKTGAWFAGGLAGSLLALAGVAWLLLWSLRRFMKHSPFRLPLTWRHGLANLYRPGNHAAAILVALGTGVTFTLAVYLLQKTLITEIAGAAPPGAPNVFLINITDREVDGVRDILANASGVQSKPRLSPLVSARLVSIDGKPVDITKLKGFERRFAQTRSVTWADEKPADDELIAGAWWPPKDAPPAVAVADDAAKTLGLKPGSTLRWNATGREFDVPVVAVFRQREVRMGPTSEFIFSKPSLAGLPVQYVGTVRLHPQEVGKLQREAYRRYPTITVVNAADVLSIVQEVVDQIALVVRFIAGFAIAAGAIILAATVASSRLRRMRETAVLKTLGARRRILAGVFSVEFAVLGASAGLLGGILATLFSRLALTRLLDAKFRFEPVPILLTIVLTTFLAVGTGWLASLRILGQKPLEVLRDE